MYLSQQQQGQTRLPFRNKRGEVQGGEDDGWTRIARRIRNTTTTTAHSAASSSSSSSFQWQQKSSSSSSSQTEEGRRAGRRGQESENRQKPVTTTNTTISTTDRRDDNHVENDETLMPVIGIEPAELPPPNNNNNSSSITTTTTLLESGVLRQYQKWDNIWKSSKTWTGLKATFVDRVAQDQNLGQITTCVCFGLGSPTGLIHGYSGGSGGCGGQLIDRRDTAMLQLAVFTSLIDLVKQNQDKQKKEEEEELAAEDESTSTTQKPSPAARSSSTTSISSLAQEPRFNELDIALLNHLGIQVVQHPEAFHRLITTTTNTPSSSTTTNSCFPAKNKNKKKKKKKKSIITFCPGAEKHVLNGVLARLPSIHLGGGSDAQGRRRIVEEEDDGGGGGEVVQTFLRGKQVYKLIDFGDRAGYALYDLHLFWACDHDHDDDREY